MKKGSKKGLFGSTLMLVVLFVYMLLTGQLPTFGANQGTAVSGTDAPAVQQMADERQYPDDTDDWQKLYGAKIVYTFRTQEQFEDHFEKHGAEMGYNTPEAYLLGANQVIASDDALHKLEAEDGDDIYYLESTNEFVVLSEDDYIRTYFLPDDGIEYYYRQ